MQPAIHTLGPKTRELVGVLERIVDLLRAPAPHWAAWMEDACRRLLNSDFSGITKLLGAYGGMGSFNDLILNDSAADNDQLDLLRERAYELATEIKREVA